jgi:hypothetical protein
VSIAVDGRRTVRIKALTVWQPWASLLALGDAGPKKYETRHFRTRYRGPIAIHSGLRRNHYLGYDREWLLAVAEGFKVAAPDQLQHLLRHLDGLPYGAIVGVGMLHEVHEILDDTWRHIPIAEKILGNYTPGRYMYELRHVQQLEKPIETRGFQGLWDWDAPADLVDRLEVPA